ncbi:MAG: hypothetical protein OEZ03_06415 [Alphaproteobacteria bacterium]|nr:hypothetical protein [Alphaproteobacteria bacterium]
MRIDRRGNPGYRKIPTAEELESNVDLTGNRKFVSANASDVSGTGDSRGGNVASTPSDAFRDLEYENHGLLKNIASMFIAVGRALKDIKQGSSRTYD